MKNNKNNNDIKIEIVNPPDEEKKKKMIKELSTFLSDTGNFSTQNRKL